MLQVLSTSGSGLSPRFFATARRIILTFHSKPPALSPWIQQHPMAGALLGREGSQSCDGICTTIAVFFLRDEYANGLSVVVSWATESTVAPHILLRCNFQLSVAAQSGHHSREETC